MNELSVGLTVPLKTLEPIDPESSTSSTMSAAWSTGGGFCALICTVVVLVPLHVVTSVAENDADVDAAAEPTLNAANSAAASIPPTASRSALTTGPLSR